MGGAEMTFVSETIGHFRYFDAQLGRPEWRGKKVLDFGGNIGNILSDSNSAIDHANYWCIDVSKHAIDIGQRRHPMANFLFYNRQNPEFNPSGTKDLDVPDIGNEFDFILAYSVFTHTSRAEMLDLVNQLKPLLAPGGRLVFSFLDPNYVPPGITDRNLIAFLRKRIRNSNSLAVEALARIAGGAAWCTLVDQSLFVETEGYCNGRNGVAHGYLAFYTAEYMRTLFPYGLVQPPVRETPLLIQHCCILKHD
jgi:2-polyprenyl-3-methyl-5-hydroxy-6-metoxy-1,4-benzoquinol methylase